MDLATGRRAASARGQEDEARLRRLRDTEQRRRERELLQVRRTERVRELTHEFARAPEQIGLYLRELMAHEGLSADEERALVEEVARAGGPELAERAFGGLPVAARSAVDGGGGGATVRDADARRRARTAELVAELAPKLGLSADEVDVRVDAEARRRTQGEGARGVMTGGTVFLNPDRYDPETPAGRSLLGHEVAHVAQQRVAVPQAAVAPVAPAGAATARRAEAEATAIGGAFAAGGAVPHAAVALPATAVAFEGPPAQAPGGQPADGQPQMTEEEAAAELRKIQAKAQSAPKPEPPKEDPKRVEPITPIPEDGGKKKGGAEPPGKKGGKGDKGGGAGLAALAPGSLSKLPGMSSLSGTLLARYGSEKAWHDNWKTQGSPTGMPAADKAVLIGEALGAGGIQGLTNAATAMVIDTLLNKATKNIPYAAGFIAIGQIAMDPKGWAQGQKAAIWDKGLAGGAKKLFGEDSDWIDRIEGVIDILDGLNNIVGLLSTICMIVAAAGFIVGLFFPPVLPFVALAAKWGLLLGQINTFVGIAITALRMITMVARCIQIAASDADPETQMKRAEKLRENTAQWTQGYAQRKMNKAREKYQQRKSQGKAAAGGGDKADAPAAGKGAAGGGKTPPAGGGATPKVQQTQTRRQRIQERLEQIGSVLGGADMAKQREAVGQAQESASNLGKHIKENQGSERVKAIQNDPTTQDALSQGSYKRLGDHYAKKETPGQAAAAQQRVQQAQQDHDAAVTARQKVDADITKAEQKIKQAADDVEQARQFVEKSKTGESGQKISAQRKVIADTEAVVPHIERQVRLKEERVRAAQREVDVLEGASRDLAAKGPEYAQAAADLRIRALDQRKNLIAEQGKLDKAKMHLDLARRKVEIEREYLKGLQDAQRAPLTKAEEALTGAQGERDRLGGERTTAQGRETEQSGRLAQAQEEAARAQTAMEQAQKDASAAGQAKAVGGDFWSGLQDTVGGFGKGRRTENLAGDQLPAAGYGHQGTGGVTGAGTAVMTADPNATESSTLKTLANPNAAVSNKVTSVVDETFGGATADTDTGDPKALERRKAAIDEARASMEANYTSMVGGLPAPPVAQEGALEEARGKYEKSDEELRQVRFQLATITELRPGMKADESALDALRKLSAANQAAIAQQEADLAAKEQKQGEVTTKIQEQDEKSTDSKSKQRAQADKTMAFVGKFLQLMGMVPSKIVSNAGQGSSGVRKLKKGVEDVGTGSDTGKEKATQAKTGVKKMGADTATAKQNTNEGKQQLDALDAEWQGDLKEVGTGIDFLEDSQRSGKSKEKELEKAMKAQQAAYTAAFGAMSGWAEEHYSLRTTGEKGVDEQLDSIEKLLDEHEAEANAKKSKQVGLQ